MGGGAGAGAGAGGPGGAAGVEVEARVLFERAVPMHVKQPEREDCVQELGVRISLTQTRRGEHLATTRVLRVQVTSPQDPFFLHSLEVDEEGFQDLKHDQSILVDFSEFPQRLIELLEHCCFGAQPGAAEGGSPAGGAVPRFLAVLSVRGEGESAVGIVETNAFKHLCHISLGFRPGTDATIKAYLAERLLEARAALQSTGRGRTSAEAQLEASRADITALRDHLAQEQAERRQLLAEADSQTKNALAEQREKFLGDLEEARARFEGDKAAAEARATERADAADARAERLDTEGKALLEEKYGLEARVAELTAKLSAAEGELGALREEADGLRKTNSKLSKSKLEAENQLQELMIKGSASGAQIMEKERQYKDMEKRVAAAEKASSALAAAAEEVKSAAQRAEERAQASAQEVRKANGVIERLQADLRGAKAKSKLKASVIQQQEALLQEKQAAADTAALQTRESRGDLERARAENVQLEDKIEDYKKKLVESQETLQQNQNMIQWLNAQVNDAQIGRLGGTSRYSFRPRHPVPEVPAGPAAPAPAVPPPDPVGA